MTQLTQEQIDALKAQGFRFKATPDGEVRLTEDEEAAFAVRQGAASPIRRRQIPKSTITARLREIGKFGAAWAALQADPDAFDRWYTADWGKVYFDDEGLLLFLDAIGLTEAEIEFVTA